MTATSSQLKVIIKLSQYFKTNKAEYKTVPIIWTHITIIRTIQLKLQLTVRILEEIYMKMDLIIKMIFTVISQF